MAGVRGGSEDTRQLQLSLTVVDSQAHGKHHHPRGEEFACRDQENRGED